jgi:hypothetical protein
MNAFLNFLWRTALACLLLAGLGFLYLKTYSLDPARREITVGLLADLRKIDASWNADVLQSKNGVSKDYDAITAPQSSALQVLDRIGEQGLGAFDGRLSDAQVVLRETIVTKSDLVDRFKRESAIMRNSMRYLPAAAADFKARLKEAGDAAPQKRAPLDAAATTADQILQEAAALESASDVAQARRLGISVARLAVTRAEYPQSVLESFDVFVRHATQIAVQREREMETLQSLSAVPLAEYTDKLDAAFDYMFGKDPFSGHVVIRSADPATPGSNYKLWTTLKVPQGYSMQKHAEFLRQQTGADYFRLMPAKRLFALGVGHVRRRGMEPGSRADVAAEVMDVNVVKLSELEWRVLNSLKREFEPEEIVVNLWEARAGEAEVPLKEFFHVAEELNRRKVVGRFSTFLEHVKPLADGERVTRFNALFHWAVPPGREIEAGKEVGRHHILTHAYWREGGPEFRNVNVMAVAHGTDRELVLKHKSAIDEHLKMIGIPVTYTNVFWGGRSEIKPSEISPLAYRDWCVHTGLDPETMGAD